MQISLIVFKTLDNIAAASVINKKAAQKLHIQSQLLSVYVIRNLLGKQRMRLQLDDLFQSNYQCIYL